jgi:hypothetical protein
MAYAYEREHCTLVELQDHACEQVQLMHMTLAIRLIKNTIVERPPPDLASTANAIMLLAFLAVCLRLFMPLRQFCGFHD